MIGDIKSTIQLLEYPILEEFIKINDEQLVKLIENSQEFKKKYEKNLDYYIGKNVTITKKPNLDKDNPDSRIAVPYSRTMTQIVKGFMYKPGLIRYESENENYINTLQEIFDNNNEPLKTSELGENQSKYGLGVELIYSNENAEIRFTPVKPQECIFIFNDDIERKLIGAIRYYVINEDKDKNIKIYRAEVYFQNRIETWEIKEQYHKKTATFQSDIENVFGVIPFALYLNNQEYHADYEPIQPLLDAYDILQSDSINEMQRFASAYLILKDYIFANPADGNEKSKELERLKTKRVLEFLGGEGGAEFLTKDIPSEFFEVVKRTLREDIEYHSHIPDFRSKTFEAASGVAMRFSLFDFENLCGDKQALFEEGLQKRIEIINKGLNIKGQDTDKVIIKFERNFPVNNTEIIQNFTTLAQSNKIADEDLLNMLPDTIITDKEAALKRMKKQKEENMEQMAINQSLDEEEEEDEDV